MDSQFMVSPSNGYGKRLVIAHLGSAEVFRDTLDTNSNEQRKVFFRDLAKRLPNHDRGALQAKYESVLLAAADTADRDAERWAAETPPSKPAWEPDAKAKREAEKLLTRPDLLEVIADTVNAMGVTGERPLICLTYLTATSRLLSQSLYLLIKGPPASGKTFIARTVCKLLPPTMLMDVTDITPNALYYLKENALKQKVLLLGERRRQIDESGVDATKSIRELTETGSLSKSVPIKGPNGVFETEEIYQEGPCALIETASHDRIALEDQSRQVTAWTNDTSEQTRQALLAFAESKASGGVKPNLDQINAIRAIQTLLEPLDVQIPFLPQIVDGFPMETVESRRAFVRLTALTEASALLHQRQRSPRGSVIDPDHLVKMAKGQKDAAAPCKKMVIMLREPGHWVNSKYVELSVKKMPEI